VLSNTTETRKPSCRYGRRATGYTVPDFLLQFNSTQLRFNKNDNRWITKYTNIKVATRQRADVGGTKPTIPNSSVWSRPQFKLPQQGAGQSLLHQNLTKTCSVRLKCTKFIFGRGSAGHHYRILLRKFSTGTAHEQGRLHQAYI